MADSPQETPKPEDGRESTKGSMVQAITVLKGAGETPRTENASSESSSGGTVVRGAALGRYVVLEVVGRGGMGIVYAAYDPELDRKVALKVLRPDVAGKQATQARARLVREAQAMARLSHPNVITVHDVGMLGENRVFVAMEFVDGMDLAKWLEMDHTWEETLDVCIRAGRGLAAAHAAGVVHRDFKPENVLVGKDGRVRVVDFGLAQTVAQIREAHRDRAPDGTDPHGDTGPSEIAAPTELAMSRDAVSIQLTQAGAIIGTPAYMAPEQHMGVATDERTDQFSFCVALFEALYGERPFAGETLPQLAYQVMKGKIREPPRDGIVPAWVRRVLLRGLSVSPADRYPSLQPLLAKLSNDPRVRRRRYMLVGGAVALAGVGVVSLVRAERVAGKACQGAERKLTGVWDDPTRTNIQSTFRQTDAPYSDDAWRSTSEYLDGYTARWVAIHREACEATSIRKEQSVDLLDRQMVCLGRRLKEVDALTTLLADANAGVVQRAVEASQNLPTLDTCEDHEALMAGEAPLVGDQAERVAKIHDLLAKAKQLKAVGNYQDGLVDARDAVGAARAAEHPATEAQALVLFGQLQARVNDNEAAEDTLYEALWKADEAGVDRYRAEAWKDLVWVVGYRRARYDEAARFARHASTALERAGSAPLLEAELHNNLGVMAKARGDADEAVKQHQKALGIREERLGKEGLKVAESKLNLANALRAAAKLDRAEAQLGEAQAMLENLVGKTHPWVASALNTRGMVAFTRNEYDKAVTFFRKATTVREQTLPEDHADLARSVHNVGEALLKLERYADALPAFQRAVELKERRLDSDHPSVAHSKNGAGLALLGLSLPDQALPDLQAALEIRRARDPNPINLAESEFAVARALVGRDPAAAVALAQAARSKYAEGGKHAQALAEVDAWLAQHSKP